MTRRSLLQALLAAVGLGVMAKTSYGAPSEIVGDIATANRATNVAAVPTVDEWLVMFDTQHPSRGCYVFPDQRKCKITWRSDGHLISAIVTDYRRYIAVHRKVVPGLGVVNGISTCDFGSDPVPAHWVRVGLVMVPKWKGRE